jgi:hypothetical protein
MIATVIEWSPAVLLALGGVTLAFVAGRWPAMKFTRKFPYIITSRKSGRGAKRRRADEQAERQAEHDAQQSPGPSVIIANSHIYGTKGGIRGQPRGQMVVMDSLIEGGDAGAGMDYHENDGKPDK